MAEDLPPAGGGAPEDASPRPRFEVDPKSNTSALAEPMTPPADAENMDPDEKGEA
eukprot:TRINITY_DN4390_c0_g1_i1.p3 TRINITY_DN4390_c0_g1~~TRINITY_DN4390_c0_g1_i1.p3  ORF type:complete len:55 (+),score=4.07 TRINITY_DN4390_c0_g1_i1:605-769(+)